MATLRDISRELGLSVTQVSRALNGHDDVSEETRARVQDIAKALKYQPNLTARKLVTGKSGIVGLVLPQVPTAPEDTLFVQIVGGLSRHFSRRQMQFVLHIAAPRTTSSTSTTGLSIPGPSTDLWCLNPGGMTVVSRSCVKGASPLLSMDGTRPSRTIRILTSTTWGSPGP